MDVRDSIVAARLNDSTQGEPSAEAEAVFDFRFPASDPIFTGHFPGHPILPGVCQIEMTRLAAEWKSGRPFFLSKVVRAKFTRPILPDETIRLRLTLTKTPEGTRASGKLSVGAELAGDLSLDLLLSS